jgi:hypothetical protein
MAILAILLGPFCHIDRANNQTARPGASADLMTYADDGMTEASEKDRLKAWNWHWCIVWETNSRIE